MKPKAGAAAKARNTTHKPLKGKRIYVDVPNSFSRAVLRTLVQDFTSLGASIEEFFTQDVKYLVTACVPPDACRSIKAAAAYPSSASPFSCATAAADSPIPAESQRSPLPGSNDGSRTSRGRAILAKANQAGAKGNLFDLARQWQINVVHVDDAQKWIEKEKQKIAACRTTADGSTKQEETSPASRSTAKQKALIPPFVKLEDGSRPYRPVYQVLESWPTLNFSASDGGSPFNNPTAAPKERGKAKKRCRVAETSLKASCDRDTFMPNPDKQSGDVSQGHLKKGSRRGEKELQEVAVCEMQKQDAESRKPGYCECCKVKYVDVTEHLKSEQHRKFASNASNYTALDLLIAGGPNMERFLEDVLRYHNVHAAEGLDASQRPGDCDGVLKDDSNNLDDCAGVFADPLPVPSSSKAGDDARGRRCRLRPDVVKSPASKRRRKTSAAANRSRAKKATEAVLSCDVPAPTTIRVASRRVNLSKLLEDNIVESRLDMTHQSLSSRSAENEETRVTCAVGDRVSRDFSGHSPRPSNHVEEICYSTVEIVPCASRENFDKPSSHEGAVRCSAKPLPCSDRQLHFDRHRVCTMNTECGQVGSACNELNDLPTVLEQRTNCIKSPGKKKCEGKKQLDPALRRRLREHWNVLSGRRNAWHRSFSEGDIPWVVDNGCPDLPTDVSYENVSELDNIFDDPGYSWVFSHNQKEFGDVREEIASIDRSVKNFGGYSDSYLDDCENFFHHRLDVLKQKENHMLFAPSLRKRNRLSVSRRYRPYGDIVVKRALFCRRRYQSGGASRSCFLMDHSIRTERARSELGATTLPSAVPAVPATVSDAVLDRNEGVRNPDEALCSQAIYNGRDTPEAIADTAVTVCSALGVSFSSGAPAGELHNSLIRHHVPAESSGVVCRDHQKDHSSASPRLVDSVFVDPSAYGCFASVHPDPAQGSSASVPCGPSVRAEPLLSGTPPTELAGAASNSTDRAVSLSPRSSRNARTLVGFDSAPCADPFGIPVSEAVEFRSSAASADTPATREQPDLEGAGSRAIVISGRNLEVPASVDLHMPPAFSRACRSSEATSPTNTASPPPDREKLPCMIKPTDETAAAYSIAAANGECVTTIGSSLHERDGSTDAQSATPACCDAISPCRVSAQSDVCRPGAGEQPFASTVAVDAVLACNSADNVDGGGSSVEPHNTTGCAKAPAHNVENYCSSGNSGACALEGVLPSAVAKSPRRSSLSREVNVAVQQKLGRHVPFGATSSSPKGKLFRSSARVPKHFDLGTIVPCFDQKKRPPSFLFNSAGKRQQRSAKNLQSHSEDPAVCGDPRDAPESTALAHVSASNRGLADSGTPLSVRSPTCHRNASSFPADLADPLDDTSDFLLSTPVPARPRRLSSANVDPCSAHKFDSGLSHVRDESQLLTPSEKQTAGIYRGCHESTSCRQERRTKSHGASPPPAAASGVEGSCVTVNGRSRSLEQLAARMNDVSPSIRRRTHSSPRSAVLLECVESPSDGDFEPAPPCGSRLARRSISPARDDLPRGLTLDDPCASPISCIRLPSSLDVSFSRNPTGAKRYLYTKISLTSSLKSNVRTSANSSSSSNNNAASACQGLKLTGGSADHSSVRPSLAHIATSADDQCIEQKRTISNGSVSAKLKGLKCDYVDDKNDPYFPDF